MWWQNVQCLPDLFQSCYKSACVLPPWSFEIKLPDTKPTWLVHLPLVLSALKGSLADKVLPQYKIIEILNWGLTANSWSCFILCRTLLWQGQHCPFWLATARQYLAHHLLPDLLTRGLTWDLLHVTHVAHVNHWVQVPFLQFHAAVNAQRRPAKTQNKKLENQSTDPIFMSCLRTKASGSQPVIHSWKMLNNKDLPYWVVMMT